ncbi:hypothetical protein PC128_g8827 [Phytophthora cactorum]|nr:hypothetical protein PC128_g8827 [Phytophthora cactorum]
MALPALLPYTSNPTKRPTTTNLDTRLLARLLVTTTLDATTPPMMTATLPITMVGGSVMLSTPLPTTTMNGTLLYTASSRTTMATTQLTMMLTITSFNKPTRPINMTTTPQMTMPFGLGLTGGLSTKYRGGPGRPGHAGQLLHSGSCFIVPPPPTHTHMLLSTTDAATEPLTRR